MGKRPQTGDDPPWLYMLWGVVMLAFSCYLYFSFVDFEEHGGRRYIQWMLALVYSIAGKWPVIGIFALMGCWLVVYGFRELKNQNKAQ